MTRNGRQFFVATILLIAVVLMTGCTWFDWIRLRVDPVHFPPDAPYAITVQRDGPIVRLSWKGMTVLYDVEDTSADADTGQWLTSRHTQLRPADTADGRYVHEFDAMPQAMRFRVRAVQVEEFSEWSHWIVSEPE